MDNTLYIINSKGEREPFSFQKVYKGARKAGASKQLALEIARSLQKQVFPGMRTEDIAKEVKRLLKSQFPQAALRFNLKEAMRKLGPSGFPFEKFIREILLNYGFEVKINQHLKGKCKVSYEVDFIAKKENVIFVGECKYHRLAGERVDLRRVLQHYARFLDIKESPKFQTLQSTGFHAKAMLVTNAKFTKEAIKYAECKKMILLGWKYPKNQGLESLIEKRRLYPITILPSFKEYLKNIFAEAKMMLAKDLLDTDLIRLSNRLNISKQVVTSLVKQAQMLLENNIS